MMLYTVSIDDKAIESFETWEEASDFRDALINDWDGLTSDTDEDGRGYTYWQEHSYKITHEEVEV